MTCNLTVTRLTMRSLRPWAPRLRPRREVVADQLVRPGGPLAQQRPRVARVDDLLDREVLGGAEGREHRAQAAFDVRAQRDRVLGRLEPAPGRRLEPAR